MINPLFHSVLTRFDLSCTAIQVVRLTQQETNISNSNKCNIMCADISGKKFSKLVVWYKQQKIN